MMQLDIFDNKSEDVLKFELIDEKINKVKTSSDNVRRGMFARHNELSRLYIELKEVCDKQQVEIDELRKLIGGKHEADKRQRSDIFGLREIKDEEPFCESYVKLG